MILRLDEKGPEPPGRRVIGLALSPGRERFNDGQKDPAGPGRGAGHSRRDCQLAEDQPVGEAEGPLAEPADEEHGDPVAEAGLDEALGEEEGGDDEPRHLVGVGGEGGGEGERLGGDGDGEAGEGPRADGEGAEDEAGDGDDEDGEEGPPLVAHRVRLGDREAEDEAEGDAPEEGEGPGPAPLEFTPAAARPGPGRGGGGGEEVVMGCHFEENVLKGKGLLHGWSG